MDVEDLSAGTQNYLKIIWGLQEWSDEPVSNSKIADLAGVRLSTVSDALKKLDTQELIEHVPYRGVTLTTLGKKYAVQMIRRHRLLETFLVEHLGYGWDEVHEEADRLEHAVSNELIDRIDRVLKHPSRDPHGDPIPGADGRVERPDARVLWELREPGDYRIERISDADNQLLQHFDSCNIAVNTLVRVLSAEPYEEAVRLRVLGDTAEKAESKGGEELRLGAAAAQAVWVSKA